MHVRSYFSHETNCCSTLSLLSSWWLLKLPIPNYHLILVFRSKSYDRQKRFIFSLTTLYFMCIFLYLMVWFLAKAFFNKVQFSKTNDWLSMIFDLIAFLPCFRAVTVENCHNSTIVLGVTKTAVNIIGCDSCTFFAVCDRISFRFVFTYLSTLNVCGTLVLRNQF